MKNKLLSRPFGNSIFKLTDLQMSVYAHLTFDRPKSTRSFKKNAFNFFCGPCSRIKYIFDVNLRDKKRASITPVENQQTQRNLRIFCFNRCCEINLSPQPFRSRMFGSLRQGEKAGGKSIYKRDWKRFVYSPISSKNGTFLVRKMNISDPARKAHLRVYAVPKSQTLSKDYSKFFVNSVFDKGRLKAFIVWFLKNYGQKKTIELLEQLKQIGFGYATKAGISLGIDDLKIPAQKADLLLNAQAKIDEGSIQYKRGEITGVEQFQRLIDTWHQTSENLKQEVIRHFEATDLLNPVYMMAFSGARGNMSQVRQLVGMRGLMADPQGQIIDFPIRSNFREGLTLTEYIISSYGARKGIVDTALRTANAGYLTRRLVDVAQHVIVSEFDCKTNRGILVLDMKEGNKTIYSFQNRLLGRVLAKDIFDKQQKVAAKNQEISAELADAIAKITKKALIRSPLTCETKKLVCQLCYGWSLATNSLVSIGEAVGIIAAQSIGEPGTQLTMRTFHTGGVFSAGLSDQIIAPNDGTIEYAAPIAGICVRTPQGQIVFLTKTEGCLSFNASNDAHSREKKEHKIWKIPPYTVLFVRNKQKVLKKQIIAQLSSFSLSGEVQKTQRSDAEQTIYAEFEGQIYTSNLDVIEKFNEYDDRSFESWGWGYTWILAGKLYQYPIQSYVFARPGDFIGKNSILNRIQWVSADDFFLNRSFVSSSDAVLSNPSLSDAQKQISSAFEMPALEMQKTRNFFQPIYLKNKRMKKILSRPLVFDFPGSLIDRRKYKIRSQLALLSLQNTKRLALNNSNRDSFSSKIFKNRLDFKMCDLKTRDEDFFSLRRVSFLNDRFRQTLSNPNFELSSIKIHSNRLIRKKFFGIDLEIHYWKLVDSIHDFVSRSESNSSNLDLLNYYYPFHKSIRKTMRKRLTSFFQKRFKTCFLSSRKIKKNSKHITNTPSFFAYTTVRDRSSINEMNRAHFLQSDNNRNLDNSNEKLKFRDNLRFRINLKNQKTSFIDLQSARFKKNKRKIKLSKFISPYVSKKTIKANSKYPISSQIFYKFIRFRKNRFVSCTAETKLKDRRLDSLASTSRFTTSPDSGYTHRFETLSKNQLPAKNESYLKKFTRSQKKQNGLIHASVDQRKEMLSTKAHNKKNLTLKFTQIVGENRNRKQKNVDHAVANDSAKLVSISLKKPVLLLSLNNIRYQKLGYHFSHDFQNQCRLQQFKSGVNCPSSVHGSFNRTENSAPLQRPSKRMPLNFTRYAGNKDKDEFFNKFSLKTSGDFTDRYESKRNTHEWAPMSDSFLQWFPSRYQTLNNGIFVFSGINSRSFLSNSVFSVKPKNTSLPSTLLSSTKTNKRQNFKKIRALNLNCHQFKRRKENLKSEKPIFFEKSIKNELLNVHFSNFNTGIKDSQPYFLLFSKSIKKRHGIPDSCIYSIDTPCPDLIKKSRNFSESNIFSKSLHQMKLQSPPITKLPLTNLAQSISTIKSFKNSLRWQNKKPKLPTIHKSFHRSTKRNFFMSDNFDTKSIRPVHANKNNAERYTQSNFFNSRAKFSVSWNEIFWMPQEDYQVSHWPFSSNTASGRRQNRSEHLPNTLKQFLTEPLVKESSHFMAVQSEPLFYLNNRQGLKKPFYSKLEGFSEIVIKSVNSADCSCSIDSPVSPTSAQKLFSPNASIGKKVENRHTELSKNQLDEINTKRLFHSSPFDAFVDFSQKISLTSSRYESKHAKENIISSTNQIHRNLKSNLMNFIKTKWQINSRNMFQNYKTSCVKKSLFNDKITSGFDFSPRAISLNGVTDLNSLCDKDQEQYSSARIIDFSSVAQKPDWPFLLKFMPKTAPTSGNYPIAKQLFRRKTIFSRFILQNFQSLENTRLNNKNIDGAVKQKKNFADRSNDNRLRVYIQNSASPSVATKNKINLDHKMRISIQPGWIYRSLNLNSNTMTNHPQKIVDFGKFVVDDIVFANHRVYVKNVISNKRGYSLTTENAKPLNSDSTPTSSSGNIEMKSWIQFDDKMHLSRSYSFNFNGCEPLSTIRPLDTEDKSFTDCFFKVQARVSNLKSRYGDFILKQKNHSSVLLLRPMQHKILPNLQFYKTKIYRAHKNLSEGNFSILVLKNFRSTSLNKQKCDQKFIATFPGIDIRVSSRLNLPTNKKLDSMRPVANKFNKTPQFKESFTSNSPASKISSGAVRQSSLWSEKTSRDHSLNSTSKESLLFSKKTASNVTVFFNKPTRFSNLIFRRAPRRHCFEQSYLTFSKINFLPLQLEFSIPSNFHYLFKIPSWNFNHSANFDFAERRSNKSLGLKFNNYVLNDLVLKNQQRFTLTKTRISALPHWNVIETKSFLNSIASMSFLPCFDFHLSAKMSSLANQRLFSSYFMNQTLSKNASLLASFGSFAISKNQVGRFESNKVSSNEPFAMTSFLSPLRGELLVKPNKNWSSETDKNRCLVLTEADLFCFYLPNLEKEIKTVATSDRRRFEFSENFVEQKQFKNKFSNLYQNFLQLEQIRNDRTKIHDERSNQNTFDDDKKTENTIVKYDKKFYKIKGLNIDNLKSNQKLRLGSLLVYGDRIAPTSAIDQAGQVVHMSGSKVTFRYAQPISVSPRGILHAYNQDFVTQNQAVITLPFQTLKTGDIVQGIPKVEQYFEARITKRGRLYRDSLPNLLQGLFERSRSLWSLEKAVRQSFLKIQQIIVDGVQRVYRSQGVSISDKHLEIIVRQMTSKVQIVHGGQTGFFPGELVDLEFVEHVNRFLLKKIYYEPVVLGITRASLEVESFLSAASFQQTTKVLSKAAVYRKKDFLKGLKENIIVGNLIPGGTGYLGHLKGFFDKCYAKSNL